MFVRKNKNNGFTLVELLTVICVLALIVGIVIVFGINIIANSKSKSYDVTVNNIQNVVSSYLLESKDNYIYVEKEEDNKLEYQCVQVERLVENGYFDVNIYDSYIDKDRKVLPNDYVYVERNKNTKSIVKSKYLFNDSTLIELCGSINPEGEITFIVEPNGYSKYKDITIKYNVKNYYDIKNYTYDYSYSDGDVEVVSDDGSVKNIKVNSNGTITGTIIGENGFKKSKSMKIEDIDWDPPVIKLDKESDTEDVVERNIKITITDSMSGLKRGGLLEYGWSDSESVEPTYEKAVLDYKNGVKEIDYTITKTGFMGTYYLWIKADFRDMLDNRTVLDKEVYGGYSFVYQFKVTINKDGGIATATESGMYIVGSEVNLSASVKEFYKFNGWSGYISSGDTSYKFIMPAHDIEINVNSLEYKCSSGERKKDSSKGYICVGGDGVGVTSKDCNCTPGGLDCTSPYTYCDYPAWANGMCITVDICLGYTEYPPSCDKCYECKKDWKTYSGSGSELKCYINATT